MRAVRNVLFALFALCAAESFAATTIATVMIDADADPQTGCAAEGGTAGFERALITTIDLTESRVVSVQRRQCSGGTFNDAVNIGGPWPAAKAGDLAQIETRIAYADLPQRDRGAAMRLAFFFTSDQGTTSFTTMPDGSPILYPLPRVGRRRSVRPADGTQTLVADGAIGDWSNLQPLLDRGLHSLWVHGSRSDLFFRFDVRTSSQPPVAANDSYAVRQGKTLVVDAPGVLENDTDAEGSELTAALAAPATHGSVSLAADGSFVYNNDGTLANDGFDYKANDGASDSNAARVTINVTPNAVPVAQNDTYSTSRGGTLSVPAPGVVSNDSDADGDPLSAAVATSPSRGTLALTANGSFTYTHDGSTEPSDTFTYTVSDGLALSVPASVTINVAASNAPPVAVDDVFHVANGGTLDVTAPGLFSNDLDSDTPQSQWTTTVVANVSHGVLTLATGGAFTYVHDGSGISDSFTYRISDGNSQSNVATVTIVAGAVNTPPTAVADNFSVDEDATLTISGNGVLGNDTDAQSPVLTVVAGNTPTHGTLTLNANGSFTYVPQPNYFGSDSFTYAASDGELTSAFVTVTIAVSAVNDLPLAVTDAYTIEEGGTLNVAAPGLLANDTDIDNATLTAFSSATNPAVNADGSFTYVHDGSETSADSFTYEARDGAGATLATAFITITEVNDAPAANADAKTTAEDTPLTIAVADLLANDDAGEAGQTIALLSTSHVQHGTVSVAAGNITFTPDADFAGTASFRYTITDDGTTNGVAAPLTAFAQVTITVTPVNDAPSITAPAALATNEDTALPFTAQISVADIDAANAPLTLTLNIGSGAIALAATPEVTLTGNGTSSVTASGPRAALNIALATATYTPATNANGVEQLTLALTDNGNSGAGTPLTADAAVAITVNAVNDVPLATVDAYNATEDTALVVPLATGVRANDTDLESAATALVVALATNVTNGTLVLANDGSFSYTPNPNFNGTDSFSYTVADANGGTSLPAVVTLTIAAVNDAPVINTPAAGFAATEDAPLTFAGGLSVDDLDAGSANLTLTVSLDQGGTLQLVNVAGVALTNNGTSSVTAAGSETALDAALAAATYTPATNYNGVEVITLHVDDGGATGAGGAQNATATANILVAAANDLPVAQNDSFATDEDTPLNATSVRANDSDLESAISALTVTLGTNVTNGTLALNADGTFTYTPNANFNGTDSFTYTVTDADSGISNAATVTITVSAVNDAPSITAPATASTNEDAPLALTTITLADTDAATGNLQLALSVDLGTLSIASAGVSVTGNGTNAITATGTLAALNTAIATLTFAPPVNYHGGATLTLLLDDQGNSGSGGAQSNSQTVAITVNSVNDLPVANADSYSTDEDTLLNGTTVRANDTDVETASNALTVTLADNVANGTLSLSNDGTFTYTPNANFFGSDSFSYTVTDADSGTSAAATVTITVNSVNDAPAITAPAAATTNEDTMLPFLAANAITVADADAGTDAVQLTLTVNNGTLAFAASLGLTVSGNGTASITATGPLAALNTALATLTFAPTTDVEGSATLTVAIDDQNHNGAGGAKNATHDITLTIATINDLPVATDDSYSTDEDTPLTASTSVRANDTDIETATSALTVTIGTDVTDGTLTLNADGTFSYTPDANFHGTDSFTYTVTDADGGISTPATVTITVNAVNDAPSITAPATATTNEDTTLLFTAANAITVADVDAGGDVTTLTLSVNNGTITLGTTTGIIASGNGTGSITAGGPVADLDAALASLSFAPAANDFGSATLSIAIDDQGKSGSGGAKNASHDVVITINSVNDLPVANADSYSTDEDTLLNGTTVRANDTDVETASNALTVTLDTNVTNGTLSLAADGTFTYTPNSNFNGTDSFTYTVADADGGVSTSATVTITIDAINDTPAITAPAAPATNEDTTLSFTAADAISIADVDAGSGNLELTLTVTNGTIAFTSAGLTLGGTPTNVIATGTLADINTALASLTFTPAANFNGSGATLEIAIDDEGNSGAGGAKNAGQTIAITVNSVNDLPTAADDSYSTDEDTPLNGTTVRANDTDVETAASALTVTLGSNVTNGTLTLNADGTFTYTPNANFNGSDSFTYTVTDADTGVSTPATATISVAAVNDAPSITAPANASTNEDSTLPFTAANAISITDVDAATDAVALTLTVSNGTIALATTTGLTVNGNGTTSITATGALTDINNALATLTFAPAGNFNGAGTTLSIAIDDQTHNGSGGAKNATHNVAIVVNAVADNPIANADSNSITEDAAPNTRTGNVVANDTDADNETLTVSAVAGLPANVGAVVNGTYGTLTIAANGAYTYTLDNARAAVQNLAAGANVNDVFNYTITDTATATASSALTIAITGTNDAPIAVADSYNLPLSGTLNATTVLANDSDADTVPAAQTLAAQIVSDDTAQGTLTLNADGTFTYVKTCSPCAQNTDTFTYRVSDGVTTSNTVTVTISYNTPPAADNDSLSGVEDAAVTINASDLLNGDNDDQGIGTVSKIFVMSMPANGTLTGLAGDNSIAASGGSMTFTPSADFSGVTTFTYQLEDNGGLRSNTATVTITLTAINDAPFFTPGSLTINVNEDSGLYNSAWATNVRPGTLTATDEVAQTLTFLVAPNSVKQDVNNPAGQGISCTGSIASGTLVCGAGAAIGNTAANRVGVTSNANLTFRTWPNLNGTANFTVQLHDNGGTVDGGVNLYPTPAVNVTVNVVPVNDPPSFVFSPASIAAQNEDSGLTVYENFAQQFNPGPNESAQTFAGYTVTADNPALFSMLSIDATTGTLTLKPVPNVHGSTTVRVTAKDSGGIANGGVDTLQKSVTVTYNSVNDAPSFTRGPDINLPAGTTTPYSAPWVVAASPGPAHEAAETLSYTIVNVSNAALFTVAPAVSPAGVLTFTPAGTTGVAVVTLRVNDSGGTANGGINASQNQTFSISVGNINTPPSFDIAGDVAVFEDSGPATFTNFITNVSPGAGPGDAGQTVTFTVAIQFTHFSSGPSLVPNGSNYNLTFTPAANFGGQVQTVTITATDNGGIAGGGVNTITKTFRLTLHEINDAPRFNVPASTTSFSDSGPQTVSGFASGIDAGGFEGCQALTFIVTGNTNPALFATAPAIAGATGCNIASGNLTYRAAAGQIGSATITVVLKDDGRTPLDPTDDQTSAPKTFDIIVQQFTGNLNDPPVFMKGPDQTVLEDSGAQTVPNWATGIAQGGDDTGQVVSFIVTSNTNSGLFSVAPAVSSTGTLTYTPALNAVGTASISIAAKDNGGTAGGGNDTSSTQSFTIVLTQRNDAPTFAASNRTVAQDAGAQTVTNWISTFAAGPSNESAQTVAFTLASSSPVAGLFSVAPALTGTPARTLTFTAAPGQIGVATLTVTAKDNGGTADGGADTTVQSYTLTIGNVNDPPAFTKGASQTVNEDSGLRTVTNWATGVSAGPADESAQNVTFEIVGNSNPALFSTGPTVTRTGATATLEFTPAANKFGVATIDIRAKDDGGTAAGAIDFSATQSFTITINNVNDVPSFTIPSPPAVPVVNAGAQSFPNLAQNITAGPEEDAIQTVTFQLSQQSTDNGSLFSVAPAISPTGTLTFTAAANQVGTAVYNVTLRDNASPQATSAAQTLTIVVGPPNQPPTTPPNRSFTIMPNMPIQIGVNDSPHRLIDGVTDPNGTSSFTVEITGAGFGSGTATLLNPTLGTFRFDPAAIRTTQNAPYPSQTFTYRVCDTGLLGQAAKCSANATVTLNFSGKRIYFWNAAAPAGGDGTLARPYNSLATNREVPSDGVGIFYSGNYGGNSLVVANNGIAVGQGLPGFTWASVGIGSLAIGSVPGLPDLTQGTVPVLANGFNNRCCSFGVTETLTVRNFVVTAPTFGLIYVEGGDEHSVYTFDRIQASTKTLGFLQTSGTVNLTNSSITISSTGFWCQDFIAGGSKLRINFINTDLVGATAPGESGGLISMNMLRSMSFDAASSITVGNGWRTIGGGDWVFNCPINITKTGSEVGWEYSGGIYTGPITISTQSGTALTATPSWSNTQPMEMTNAANLITTTSGNGIDFNQTAISAAGVKFKLNVNGGNVKFVETTGGTISLLSGSITGTGAAQKCVDRTNAPNVSVGAVTTSNCTFP